LAFWKAHESTLPILALLAKKFLAVPASSASVGTFRDIFSRIKEEEKV